MEELKGLTYGMVDSVHMSLGGVHWPSRRYKSAEKYTDRQSSNHQQLIGRLVQIL